MSIDKFVWLFILWNGMGGIILLGSLASDYSSWFGKIGNWAFVNPFVVYRFNKVVNWFGAIMIALALSAVCPIGAVFYWVYKLGWLFCKLCTVGRK